MNKKLVYNAKQTVIARVSQFIKDWETCGMPEQMNREFGSEGSEWNKALFEIKMDLGTLMAREGEKRRHDLRRNNGL